MKVEEIMVKDVVTVKDSELVIDAVELMNEHEIGCLVVVNDGKAIGMLTERDMLKRVLARSIDPKSTKVGEVMSVPLVTVDPQDEVEETARLMFRMEIKKLPVVEDEQLLGLVTLTDLVRFQPELIDALKKLGIIIPRRMEKTVIHYVV
ncbi:MAG: CBS domain-containing protein [Candidatus Bathyarchaeota archaeon]|nr:MAG: CBS domain-containing protein [Candidatus Bathyarchaeota archaeon]